MNSSLVSVVVPNYNYGKYLGACLDSIIAQTYTNIEILIADGGSSDNSIEIIEKYASKYPNIKLVSKKDTGQSNAINIGMTKALGQYITWLNSDDELVANAIEYAVKEFESDENLILVYGSVINKHENGTILELNKGLSLDKSHLSYLDFIPQTGAVFKRVDNFYIDESYNWGLDWDLWIRLAQYGEIKNTNKIMGYCITEGQIQRKSDQVTIKRTRELLKITKKYSKNITSNILFTYLAIGLGFLLKPIGFFYNNYYLLVLMVMSKLHQIIFRKEIML